MNTKESKCAIKFDCLGVDCRYRKTEHHIYCDYKLMWSCACQEARIEAAKKWLERAESARLNEP